MRSIVGLICHVDKVREREMYHKESLPPRKMDKARKTTILIIVHTHTRLDYVYICLYAFACAWARGGEKIREYRRQIDEVWGRYIEMR